MFKRLLSWLLVLTLLAGVGVTALADDSTEPEGGGCKHFYSIPQSAVRPIYTFQNYSTQTKETVQSMKCAYCASVAVVHVEPTVTENHKWVIISKVLIEDRYRVEKKCSGCKYVMVGYEN